MYKILEVLTFGDKMNIYTGLATLFISLVIFLPAGGSEKAYINVGLSANYRPSYAFIMSSALTKVHLSLWNNRENDKKFENYRINVVVESMTCFGKVNNLAIQMGNRMPTSMCFNVSNGQKNWEAVNEIYDGETEVHIEAQGNWGNKEAHLVASIYYEIEGNCDECDENSFCCDNHNSQCTLKRYFPQRDSRKVRCIPKFSHSDGGGSLLCDGHPNCGRFCNADESNCGSKTIKTDSKSYPEKLSDFDGLQLTFIILGLFFVISLVYIAIMLSPTGRKFFGISTMFPSRTPNDDAYGQASSSTNSSIIRSYIVFDNSLSIATISRPENDLPPRYDQIEMQRKTEHYPEVINEDDLDLPSFTEAVSFTYRDFSQIASPSGNGIENPAYEYYKHEIDSPPKGEFERY